MKTDILRQKFLDFFKSKKHKIVESDSLVPKDDQTVLFTPAGMNQFKKEFLGLVKDFRRAATSQRCLRTDDLEKVGHTSGHHTFFEMLGNFSFGDYFKKEAIAWAWEFLTRELKVNPQKLWVSVYKDDAEAYAIWKDTVKIPEQKIVRLGDKENFWPSEAKTKGPNGPCGPCSEIFFDFGKDTGCGKSDCTPACGCARFVEIWNLVFTQFNRKEGGMLEPLPQKNIDTGMGLERLAAVMQGVKNNFETDLFAPIIKEIKQGIKLHPLNEKELIYAVSDHIRAITFSIYDGIMPSNEGRGYVVRKIIRKCVMHLRALGIDKPYLYKLTAGVAQVMKMPYPEISKRRENIAQIILSEEKGFIATLNSSANLFKEKFAGFTAKPDAFKAGVLAFQLYDTHGIPLELTRSWLNKEGIAFSQVAFDKELEDQKSRSKLQSAMKGDVFDVKELKLKIKETKFLGYEAHKSGAKILKLFKLSAEARKINPGETAEIVLDKSPFYAESGGQVGDAGLIVKGKNIFIVLDTKKTGKVTVHMGRVKQGSFKENMAVSAEVDFERRMDIARNHTATHLLQAALRKVLGSHVKQQGSLVAAEKLRFDFTHFKDIGPEELKRVEETVNDSVMGNYALSTKILPLANAKKTGALAFFAEKYEGKIRVVSIGDISRELCGGTHLKYTGQIGLFKIIQESSVASGIRRIEAVTGKSAYWLVREEEAIIEDAARLLNTTKDKVAVEIGKKLSQLKELDKRLNTQKLDSVKSSLDDIIREAAEVNGIKVVAKVIDGLDMGILRTNVDLVKQKISSGVVALGSGVGGKAMLVVGVTQDLTEKGLDASALVTAIAKFIGGSGGGRKDFAQAGGNAPQNFTQAFEELKNLLANFKK
ncbi:MAG: alanine--tRNA ligase [Candidatus Omnitrophica bacterium]|nr:alanine--tRNA ligase [Candidatus Omnitrophota bacterium]